MGLYRKISAYYDLLFGLSAEEKTYFAGLGFSRNERVLDVGCATGGLALYLSDLAGEVIGIDLDQAMISEAVRKSSGKAGVSFKALDMRRISGEFGDTCFDLVFCTGNTLAHLEGPEELDGFFSSVFSVLKYRGGFVLQIMNYDRILDQSVSELPPIENASVKFKRRYEPAPDGRLRFDTELTIRGREGVIRGSELLYPFRKSGIESAAARAGFREGKYFSGFDRSEWSASGRLLVGEFRKPGSVK